MQADNSNTMILESIKKQLLTRLSGDEVSLAISSRRPGPPVLPQPPNKEKVTTGSNRWQAYQTHWHKLLTSQSLEEIQAHREALHRLVQNNVEERNLHNALIGFILKDAIMKEDSRVSCNKEKKQTLSQEEGVVAPNYIFAGENIPFEAAVQYALQQEGAKCTLHRTCVGEEDGSVVVVGDISQQLWSLTFDQVQKQWERHVMQRKRKRLETVMNEGLHVMQGFLEDCGLP